jgi:hypothetical protein
MVVSTTAASSIAVEFGNHDANPGWYKGFLVACAAEKKERTKQNNNNPEKLGVWAFGKQSRRSDKNVNAYLVAWEAAAKDDLVPFGKDLSPGDVAVGIAFNKSHTQELWDQYFNTAAAPKRAKDRKNKSDQSKKKKTSKIAKEIATDPEAKKAARKALQEEDRKEFEAKQKAAREKIAEIELNAIAAGGRVPTDEEMEPKKGKLSAIHDRMAAEAKCIGDIERVLKWQKDSLATLGDIIAYGSIPDNGGVSMGQMQDAVRIAQDFVWGATPMIPFPEESEKQNASE